MSQSGELRIRGAAPGPYGPENAPPPPPGPPPSQADRQRGREHAAEPPPPPQQSQPAKEFERPFRKLNSRQRKNRRHEIEMAELEESVRSGRSRSPVRREEQSSQVRYREQSLRRQDEDQDHRRRGRGPLHQNRQPLRDARQFTPDQIVDETYGRLSPGMDVRDQYHESDGEAQCQPVERNEWPDERSWSPRRGVGEQSGQASHIQADWNGNDARSPEQTGDGHGAAAGRYKRPHSMASLPPAHSSQAFDIEDEVDWGDDEPADVPGSIQPSTNGKFRGLQPQGAAFKSQMRHPKRQGKKRAFSPPCDEQSWQRRPWQAKDRKAQPPQSQPNWGPDPGQRQPKAQSGKSRDRGRDFGGPSQNDHSAFNKLGVQANLALLQDDPALLQAPEVPDTVYDLRKYDSHITALHKSLPRHLRFINGNGKAAPYIYGSIQGLDLGLCFSTFCTGFRCEMGVKCAWRHHPLTKAEREWILAYGRERGKQFLEKLAQFWAVPEVPVPGASMHDK